MKKCCSLRGCIAMAIAGATLLTSVAEAQQPRSSIDRRLRPNGGFWEGSSGARTSSSSIASRSQWSGSTVAPRAIPSGNIVSRGNIVSPNTVTPGAVVRSTTVQPQPPAVSGQVAMPSRNVSQPAVVQQQATSGRVYYTYPSNTWHYPGGYVVVPNSGQQTMIVCQDGQPAPAVAAQSPAAQQSENLASDDGQQAKTQSAQSLASEKSATETKVD